MILVGLYTPKVRLKLYGQERQRQLVVDGSPRPPLRAVQLHCRLERGVTSSSLARIPRRMYVETPLKHN